MAAKRRRSPPPPVAAAQSPSSDDDSSSDETQYIAQRNPPRTERDDDESDSDSDSESDTDTPTKTLITPQKPSQSEDSLKEDEEKQEQVEKLKSPAKTLKASKKLSALDDSSGEDEEEEEQEEAEKPKLPAKTLKTSQKLSESEEDSDEEDEEEEEEQKQVEKLKSPAKEPESQPDKKKLKLSTPDQSPSNKSSFQRIWSVEDEMVLLRAMSEYQVRNGKLPPRKDYASFLSGISGFISFPVTETQLFNKIRQSRQIYSQKKKKGSFSNFSQPHEKAVFDLYTKLFEATSKVSKKRASPETSGDAELESGSKQKKRITEPGSLTAENGGVANGSDVTRSHFYLTALIKDMIHTKQCPGWLSTVEDVVALIGESRVKDLEAKTKMLRIDKIKLQAREEKLMGELFDVLADEMAGD